LRYGVGNTGFNLADKKVGLLSAVFLTEIWMGLDAVKDNVNRWIGEVKKTAVNERK
jgi:hypothetical protein